MIRPTDRVLDAELPRLAYVGDVPVRATSAGSILLHRLLETYPPERLRIVEADVHDLPRDRKLSGVEYEVLRCLPPRLLYSRFTSFYARLMHITAPWYWRRAEKLLRGFEFDAVLTVMHGFSWRTAAVLAMKHKVPLHTIVHDDWYQIQNEYRKSPLRVSRDMGDVYRQSASRLCVCPQMERAYFERYGVPGSVLYPSRSASSPNFMDPPTRLGQTKSRFTVVYAGSIFISGYATAMSALAGQLERIGGRMIIYCTVNRDLLSNMKLDRPNIEVRNFIPAEQVVGRLRDEADAVFVPMTFQPELRVHMSISFPSKIAEYTAAGVPMLIWGPEYCSAVQWARSNAPVAEVVDSSDPAALEAPLKRMAESSELRRELGQRALDVGRQFFAQDQAFSVFARAITAK